MTPATQCRICGETRFEGWTYCPACGYGYDWDDKDDEGADTTEDER